MYERVLIAIDGSPHSERAIEAGADLARLSNGEVRLVHVREILLFPVAGAVPPDEGKREAGQMGEEAAERLRSQGVKATACVRDAVNGHVARQLLEEAEEWQASVMVLASRGLTDIAGIVIGSTTHKVLHLGHLPVLVVR